MPLISLPDAKQQLGIGDDDTSKNALLEAYVDAVAAVIEDLVGPVDSDSKTATFDGGRQNVVLPTPAASVTSVTVNGTALPITAYTVNLTAGIVHAGSSTAPDYFPAGQQNIVVSYTVGSDSEPAANLKLAARELLRFWWQLGQQGNRPGFGDAPQAEAPAGFAVPRRVVELCKPNLRAPSV